MLIDTNALPKPGDVVGFRLTTGDEIIARVAESTASHLTVTKPVVVQMAPVGQGQVGLAFAPFMVTVPEDARFRFALDSMVAAPIRARADLTAKYTEMTSGIVPAGAGALPTLGR
jgi:hypothetical protein